MYLLTRSVAALLVALLLTLVGTGRAFALDPERPVHEYTLTAWSMQDGLPHNLIHRISQSADGFLWIATWEGAARFNGQRFTVFDARSAAGPEILGVRGLLNDADGSLLFGTTQFGVRRLSGGRWESMGGPAAARLKVTTLLRDRGGALWIGTEQSLFRLDVDGSLHATGSDLGLDGNLIYSLVQLANGDLLIGNDRGLHRLREGRITALGDALKLPQANVRSVVAAKDGSAYAGGNAGVWRIDAAQSSAVRLLDDRVEAMIEDRAGTLWISTTAQGLVRFHDGRFDRIDQRLGLMGRGSSALFEDREGLLWVGTTNGLYRLSDGPVFGIDGARGLTDGYVRAVVQARDGAMWLGHAVGVDRWNKGTLQRIDLAAPGRSESSVLSLALANDGGIWLGTYDQGVLKVTGNGEAGTLASKVLDRSDGLPSNHVRTLHETRDGTLWIGTTDGLARIRDGVLRNYRIADGLPSDFIRVVHESADGMLWIGTSAGIARLAPDGTLRSWRAGIEFPAVGSFDFLDDADGSVWIASDRGLLRLRNDRFSVYDHARGMPRDTLFRVLDDAAGGLWLSSNGGVFRVLRSRIDDVDAGRRSQLDVDVFDHDQGMPSSQANGGSTPAGWRSDDGRLWIPTADGVAVIDPKAAEHRRSTTIPIAFEKVEIDGESQPLSAAIRVGADARRLVIGYAGLSFRAGGDVRYRYRMSGFDERWFNAGSGTEAVFTNLPPGLLRFEVQSLLQPADWNQATTPSSAAIAFTVEAPYWRTAWFIALLSLGVLALLLGVYRWRLASYRRRQRQLADIIGLRTQELSQKNAALEQAQQQGEALLLKLAHQANHDSLTLLPNRRAGDSHLLEAVRNASEHQTPLHLGLLDIDRFKHTNDQYGHDAGDAVLKMVAAILREPLGANSFAARHGGEEFLITLTGSSDAEAEQRLRTLCERIAATPVAGFAEQDLGCTVSIGVAHWSPAHDARSLLALADRRLYRAKQEGRNRVVGEDPTPV